MTNENPLKHDNIKYGVCPTKPSVRVSVRPPRKQKTHENKNVQNVPTCGRRWTISAFADQTSSQSISKFKNIFKAFSRGQVFFKRSAFHSKVQRITSDPLKEN